MLTTGLALALACSLAAPAAQQRDAAAAGSPPAQGGLRTFAIDKPVEPPSTRRPATGRAIPFRLPKAHDALRTTVGIGYVQGADWGTEVAAGGGIAGAQVQFHTLLTRGRDGLVFDQGAISVFDPDSRWRAEGGDIFSHLRGASRGARLSWQPGAGGRRPAFAVYGPGRGSTDRTTVVSYRDQLQVGEQTLLDAEVASDRSFVLRSRLAVQRFDVEAFYRSGRQPSRTKDASVSAGLNLWRGVGVTGGLFQSFEAAGGSEWRTVAVRFPLGRFLHLTLERAYAATPTTAHTTSAAMANVSAGGLRFFHRYQLGEYDFLRSGSPGSVERQQTQSAASYNAGSRLNVVLQMATQRTETGRVQHWEEMQTTLRLSRTTTLRTVTAVPDVRDSQRWRGFFRQELPRRFALQADYGRLSAFQSVPAGFDRSRFKLMLFKTWDVATPARGAEVKGRVVDDAGRGVAGAGVRLGAYLTETDASGRYVFKYVPAGQYDLALDQFLLPADVAWDGRQERLTLAPGNRVQSDLRVAPLNAIHGRVYSDRNGNGRFDSGEGEAGVAVRLDDRITATDQAGAYTFYNLWPATYVIRLHVGNLPSTLAPSGATELTVTLGDQGPVTGADFTVVSKTRPIIWSKASK